MTDKNFEDKMTFTLRQIDACYINSLVALVNACRANGVHINTVETYQNGFRVTFESYCGDAICHDGSYCNPISNRYFEKK